MRRDTRSSFSLPNHGRDRKERKRDGEKERRSRGRRSEVEQSKREGACHGICPCPTHTSLTDTSARRCICRLDGLISHPEERMHFRSAESKQFQSLAHCQAAERDVGQGGSKDK